MEGLAMIEPWETMGAGRRIANMDVEERDADFVVTCELPGFDSKDIKVTLDKNTISIEADTTEDGRDIAGDGDGDGDTPARNMLREERMRCHIIRRYQFSIPVDKDAAIDGKLENGVLTLNIPKDTSKLESVREIPIIPIETKKVEQVEGGQAGGAG